jgi:SnoaL-like domain
MNALTKESISAMVTLWYQALDRHDDLTLVLPFLVEEGLEMHFPEGVSSGREGFTDWYRTVTRRFFDEVHTVKQVEVSGLTDTEADVKVVVNWQARIWDPPGPRSQWLGFDAYQTWKVTAGSGGPQILTYIVDSLDPMPGSASL